MRSADDHQPAVASARMPWWAWALFAVIILVLLLSARSEDPEVKQRIRDTIAVEECWKEYERKSLEPATKRFIASGCERMEREFADKHGRKP